MADPAHPNEIEPASPFSSEHANAPVIETIEIATEGEECDECVRKLREPLMKMAGVNDVRVDTVSERVIVRYDARKTNPPELHDAILKSGYKPVPFAEPEL
jgi:copper chaperone CopZ